MVDGEINTGFATKNLANSWWWVDLEKLYVVQDISFLMRANYIVGLKNVSVSLSTLNLLRFGE